MDARYGSVVRDFNKRKAIQIAAPTEQRIELEYASNKQKARIIRLGAPSAYSRHFNEPKFFNNLKPRGVFDLNSSQQEAANDIYILDDDANVRKTVCTILNAGGYRGVCFADGQSLLEAIRQRCPAAILLDLNLRGRSGLEILKDLAAYSCPVIMISGHGNISTAVQAMKDGARDFIEKPFKGSDLISRLGKVTAGFPNKSSKSLQQMLSTVNFPGRQPLTPRERDVVQCIATGLSNKEIAEKLEIGFRTVESHRSNIMHKLGVKTLAELLITVLK